MRDPDLAGITSSVLACSRCTTMNQSARIPGRGVCPARIAFVGEAPGRLGAGRTGLPFRGDRSGDLFARMLEDAGLDASSIYVTNAVKCVPLDGRGRNRRPSPAEAVACACHLRREMEVVRPVLAVTLGALACRMMTGLSLRAALLRVTPGLSAVPCFALYHPAYVGRHRYALDDYRRDWRTLGRLVQRMEANV